MRPADAHVEHSVDVTLLLIHNPKSEAQNLSKIFKLMSCPEGEPDLQFDTACHAMCSFRPTKAR